jgi:putative ABC transport system permease protein
MVSVNIASLLLARGVAAPRTGDSPRDRRWPIPPLRQLLMESLTLSFLGSATGVLLAECTMLLLVHIGPASIPRLDEASMDFRVLAFAFCITLATGILFGIAPAFALWRTDLHDALKQGARGTGGLFGFRILFQ